MGRTSRLVPSPTTRALSRCDGAVDQAGGEADQPGVDLLMPLVGRRALHRCKLRLRGGLGRLQRQDNRREDGEPHNRRAENIAIIARLSFVPTKTSAGRLCPHSLTQCVQSFSHL